MLTNLTFYICECGNDCFKIHKEKTENGLFINTKIIANCTSCKNGILIKEINEEIH